MSTNEVQPAPSVAAIAACPSGLHDALAAADATVTRHIRVRERVYLWAHSSEQQLFGWFSSDDADAKMLDHDARVRELVGSSGALRAPPILARGVDWRLEPDVKSLDAHAPLDASVCARAAEELASLELPMPPASGRAVEGLATRLRRQTRLAFSALPVRDLWSAGRIIERSPLPQTLSHGAFQLTHVFAEPSGIWVIDWEHIAPRPAGWDLLFLSWDLNSELGRRELFEAAVELVGETHRRELVKLHFAALVKLIAGSEFARAPLDDGASVYSLLAQLDGARSAAASAAAD